MIHQWAPIARGVLARPYSEQGTTTRSGQSAPAFASDHSEASKQIVSRVEELAKKKGWTMSQVSLAWVNKRVSSPIVGISSIKRLDEATDLRGKVLTDEEEKYLEEPYVPVKIAGHS